MPRYDVDGFDPPAPTARVTLRGPDGSALSDVMLLIDTGADVTLLPRESVERLGVAFDPALRHELVGFDGSRSSVQAVDLDVLFLNKAFRGRYLLIDDSRGILGRDVLNALKLLFDGPGGEWTQQR
jgi:predicted aspartyl protease